MAPPVTGLLQPSWSAPSESLLVDYGAAGHGSCGSDNPSQLDGNAASQQTADSKAFEAGLAVTTLLGLQLSRVKIQPQSSIPTAALAK